MKSCTIRRRFWTAEAAGTAITVDLEPGFGTPQACLIMYTETSAATDAFDTTLASRNVGMGMIGSTDSRITSNLTFRSVTGTMTDAVSPASVRRQDSNTRYIVAQNNTGASIFWQFSSASFSADKATFTPTATTPQTNGHLETIMTFFTGTGFSVGIGNSSFPTTAAGTRVFSGLSWQPDVILIASIQSVLNTGLTDDFRFSFGCATRSPLTQKGIYLHQENSATPAAADMGTASSSNVMITYSTVTGATLNTHTISNINNTGWTFTSSAAAGGNNGNYIFMALSTGNPADFALVDILTNTATGDQFTGLGSSGFVPKTVLGGGTLCPTDNTRAQTAPNADGIALFAGNRSNNSLYWNGPGTISTSTANPTVTGLSTEFFRFAPGDRIYQVDGTLIGVVSTVSSKTSMTFVSNSAATLSGVSYVYSNPGQYCIGFGTSQNSNPMNVFSGIASTFLALPRGIANAATNSELVLLSNFDTRPGFNLNHTSVSGTARRGWALAIANEDSRKRRGSVS
jgi:hypothetical protein